MRHVRHLIVGSSFLLVLGFLACSPTGSGSAGDGDSGDGDAGDGDISVGDGDSSGDGDINVGDGDTGGDGDGVDDPTTCAEAANAASYIGCDFWPTITANPVFDEFSYAVVVANAQEVEAVIEITGPNGFATSVTVPAGELGTIELPWVTELKGPTYNAPNGDFGRLTTSLSMVAGAYHMTSSVPVTTWQFSPLKYAQEGAACGALGDTCRSASNDASLLIPSTAMTGNYRVVGYSGARGTEQWGSAPMGFAMTATADGTSVQVQLPPDCDHGGVVPACVVAGGVVPSGNNDDVLTFQMNQGDVIQILGSYPMWQQEPHADLSGTLINATKPIQVISFIPIANIPEETTNADHVEETVLPAEVIGNKYIVVPPTYYQGGVHGHIVRIYGNVNNTNLTYPEGKPAGAPDTIHAGEVVEIPTRMSASNLCTVASCIMNQAFVVEGDQPFAVASFMPGGKLQVPNYPSAYDIPGDPAMSMMVTPEQFRQSYTFLAPADFMENYADILVPDGAEVILNGAPLTAPLEAIGASGWSVARVLLSSATGGIHTLSTTHAAGLGLQVMGYGNATSFYYPGGLNLKRISEPPVVVVR